MLRAAGPPRPGPGIRPPLVWPQSGSTPGLAALPRKHGRLVPPPRTDDAVPLERFEPPYPLALVLGMRWWGSGHGAESASRAGYRGCRLGRFPAQAGGTRLRGTILADQRTALPPLHHDLLVVRPRPAPEDGRRAGLAVGLRQCDQGNDPVIAATAQQKPSRGKPAAKRPETQDAGRGNGASAHPFQTARWYSWTTEAAGLRAALRMTNGVQAPAGGRKSKENDDGRSGGSSKGASEAASPPTGSEP